MGSQINAPRRKAIIPAGRGMELYGAQLLCGCTVGKHARCTAAWMRALEMSSGLGEEVVSESQKPQPPCKRGVGRAKEVAFAAVAGDRRTEDGHSSSWLEQKEIEKTAKAILITTWHSGRGLQHNSTAWQEEGVSTGTLAACTCVVTDNGHHRERKPCHQN
eukprot:GGOE01029350.1.p4 GENE.GGOE01029350.1~~GGOE01029350.1.p4  ORF type:complete len:161 (-),score=11.82 GGOE01029350.1:322-804(-)